MKQNNSSLTGILLLVLLWMTYIYITTPSQQELAEQQRKQDELIAEQQRQDSLNQLNNSQTTSVLDSIDQDTTLTSAQRDSLQTVLLQQQQSSQYGAFVRAAKGTPKEVTLENEELKITFSSKGGKISKVEVKDFLQYNHETKDDKYDKEQLVLMADDRDRFEYFIPHTQASKGEISTADLFFEPTLTDNTLILRAYGANDNQYIEQKYTINDDYVLDYELKLEGLQEQIKRDEHIELVWSTYVPKVEKNPHYEKTMTTVYYQEDDFSYCDCRQDDQETLEKPVKWLSHSQQFFNTSLIAKEGTVIHKAELATKTVADTASHLKELYTTAEFHTKDQQSATYAMQMYIGPNDYNELIKMDNGIEQIIPFGWSIFGFISRSVIRPLFNFFAMFISNYGIIILLLTLLIRLCLFPLQYKMLLNGVKMSVLKPELEAIRKKNKDDQQAQQMAQMKLYQEYGVNPLGGCLPMLMTMPIWIALYRFFPASIDFRQKSFLWADDLVSYDSIWDFGYVPFINMIYGDHVSLFTLLWVLSMFAFLWYNSKHMNMQANNPQMQSMKYMQFAFPVIFFFALNNWASGLTAYMLFSNVFNIAQTYVTKNILIDKDKLKAKMDEKKKKNKEKPKGGMFAKYQEMLAEQQRLQEKEKKKKNKKK